ncbi:ankyrin repeat domain-containing protein [Thiotrichales bacterium 19S11-10]|nr:ankyrin repeat domain-containing protein [Thiotrichales bacterium 19S11-10]
MGIDDLIKGGKILEVEKLLKKYPYDKKNIQHYCNLLLIAVGFEQEDIVRLILSKLKTAEDKKKVINTPHSYINNTKQYTVIYDAIYSSNIEILKMLIKAGADVNYKNTNKTTPLHHAAQLGDIEKVKLLIENGADANTRNKIGRIPLVSIIFAIKKADQQNSDQLLLAVKILIEKSDKDTINDTDTEGNTPLYYFVKAFNDVAKGSEARRILAECIECLIEKGADPSKQNKDNKRPVELADEACKKHITKGLEKEFNLIWQKEHPQETGENALGKG